MVSAAELSQGKHEEAPEYLEHGIWPALIAMATGVAFTGLFFLLKGMILIAGILMMLSFGAVFWEFPIQRY